MESIYAVKINNVEYDIKITNYAECDTSGNQAAKTAIIKNGNVDQVDFAQEVGARVAVKFKNKNTVSPNSEGALTLNINGTGDVPIYKAGVPVDTSRLWEDGQIVDFIYTYEEGSPRWNIISVGDSIGKIAPAGMEQSYVDINGIRVFETIGENAQIFNDYENNIAIGDNSHAEGYLTVAVGINSHAEGLQTYSTGKSSHSEGERTVSSGDCSHAQGYNTIASGERSHAEGSSATNTSTNVFYQLIASGIGAHAEGGGTQASGKFAHSEGAFTQAIGNEAHAEGNSTVSSGKASHAEGANTISSGTGSHAEGQTTKATGEGAHAEGGFTEATQLGAHAEGGYSKATALAAHAEGNNTIAGSNFQHVQGKYNIEDANGTYQHIVGNGEKDAPSNAHTLDWDGNAWFSGEVYVGSISGTNKDAGSKKLATEDTNFISTSDIDAICSAMPKVSTFILPKGRMRGDVNGDGVINRDDATFILTSLAAVESLNEIQNWCGDVDLNGKADSSDAVKIMGGGTFPMADYYGNWTYLNVDNNGYFYYDIPVEEAIVESTVFFTVSSYENLFIGAECLENVVRIKAKSLPISDVKCFITVE